MRDAMYTVRTERIPETRRRFSDRTVCPVQQQNAITDVGTESVAKGGRINNSIGWEFEINHGDEYEICRCT